MRRASRAIVIKDNQLLVMHRNKFGTEYLTLPGGNIEVGESPEQALYRELFEETSIEITNPRFIILEHSGDPYGDQYIFLCDYVNGEPALHPEAEEVSINKLGKNLYTPMWIELDDFSSEPFLSQNLQNLILSYLKDGWPESAVEITTK